MEACSICGRDFDGHGHNAAPVATGRCCDECYVNVLIARTLFASCETHTETDGSWLALDARGIPLCRVCPKCVERKLSRYRPEVLIDPDYAADEPTNDD